MQSETATTISPRVRKIPAPQALRNRHPAMCFDKHMKPASPEVLGVDVDAETRCAHYHSALDIIAIRMACCGAYYACKDCHAALADHAIKVWPRSEWGVRAILCGACGYELTIREYMSSGYRCPHCNAGFNPGCRNHYHFYFAPEETA
jgi:uncharacterized CHY-type Zn-finger protein